MTLYCTENLQPGVTSEVRTPAVNTAVCTANHSAVTEVPVIIIIIFGENNGLGPIYINIYKFRGWWERGVHMVVPYNFWGLYLGFICFTFHFSFTIHKNGTIPKTRPMLKANSYNVFI